MISQITTKYYTAEILLRPLLFDSEEDIKTTLKTLKHKECIIFIANCEFLEAYTQSCFSINEMLDTEISILFYIKQGNSSKDNANENYMSKHALEGEKFMEIISGDLDPEGEYADPPISPEEEKLGMPRVVEALECNMWASMIKTPFQKPTPKIPVHEGKAVEKEASEEIKELPSKKENDKEETKEERRDEKQEEEEREQFDPNRDYEKETNEFENLMNELLKVKEVYTHYYIIGINLYLWKNDIRMQKRLCGNLQEHLILVRIKKILMKLLKH